MTFWLVLLVSGGSAPLHVGTFTTLASCETAAKQAVPYNPGAPSAPHVNYNFVNYNFVCVQASEPGAQPPN
jgi:hypothetical protein